MKMCLPSAQFIALPSGEIPYHPWPVTAQVHLAVNKFCVLVN